LSESELAAVADCEATFYRKLEACATENPDSAFSIGAKLSGFAQAAIVNLRRLGT
jgi:hypothetical protein